MYIDINTNSDNIADSGSSERKVCDSVHFLLY